MDEKTELVRRHEAESRADNPPFAIYWQLAFWGGDSAVMTFSLGYEYALCSALEGASLLNHGTKISFCRLYVVPFIVMG